MNGSDWFCDVLSAWTGGRRTCPADGSGEAPDWDRVVALANQHLIVPMLHEALAVGAGRAAVPQDVLDYLAFIHGQNALRNREIREECRVVHELLSGAGLAPVFLKGGAFVLADGSAAPWRMMSDIDVLVRPAGLDAAYEVLTAAGFAPLRRPDRFEGRYQRVPLGRPGTIASIELHRHLGEQRAMLRSESVIAEALPAAGDAGPMIPRATHRLIHAVLHWQMQDGGFRVGAMPLRAMVDIAILSRDPDIDWRETVADARRSDYYRYLAAALHIVGRAFGHSVPEAISEEPWVRDHVDWCWALQRSAARRRRALYLYKLGKHWDGQRIAYALGYDDPWSGRARAGILARRALRLPKIAMKAVAYGAEELFCTLQDLRPGARQ